MSELPPVIEQPHVGMMDHMYNKRAALIAAGVATVAVLVSPTFEEQPAHAGTAAQVIVGMPFTGRWGFNAIVDPPYTDSNSSHPSVHAAYGFNWATDLYAAVDTEVRVYGSSPQGTVTFKRNATSDTCSSYGSNIAGRGVTFDVLVDGTEVGEVKYDHLDLTDIGNNAIASGTKIGEVTSEPTHSTCYQTSHTHVQFKNTVANNSCYVDHGRPGEFDIAAGDSLGVLGSSNTGVKQACESIPSGTVPPSINTTPTADINGDGNDELLLLTHDPDGATGANVGLSTNSGFWMQPEWWHDPYTDFNSMTPYIGDVSGDGKADLTYLIPTANGTQVWVLRSAGAGFQSPQLWWNGVGYQFDGIKAAIGDIDKNGAQDLILLTRQAAGGIAISVALSTQNGFWLQSPWHTDGFTDWNRTMIFAGDVNGDGVADPTLLVATPDGTDAWVQLSNKAGLGGPQLWWNGPGYQFDGIKAVMGDIDGNGAADLILATHQSDGGTAVSPLLSTNAGFWLQAPWWTDVYTDWNNMTPTAGNFTGSRRNNHPVADFGYLVPTPTGTRAWVLPSTTVGLQAPQSWWADGWGYSGIKVARSY